jgi:hypothetical protein
MVAKEKQERLERKIKRWARYTWRTFLLFGPLTGFGAAQDSN